MQTMSQKKRKQDLLLVQVPEYRVLKEYHPTKCIKIHMHLHNQVRLKVEKVGEKKMLRILNPGTGKNSGAHDCINIGWSVSLRVDLCLIR